MIEVRGLTKVYETPGETIRVLDGLDLLVEDGGTASVVGPSGCGKSTLLNMVGALDRPTEGSIVIGGQDRPFGWFLWMVLANSTEDKDLSSSAEGGMSR